MKNDTPTLVVRPREWMRELGIGKHGLALLIRDHGHVNRFLEPNGTQSNR